MFVTLLFFFVLRIKGMQRENKHGDTIFLLPLSVLCLNINSDKFVKNLDSTSFSRQLLQGPFFLVSHVVNGQGVTQSLLCDILKDSCEGDYALYKTPF